MQKLSNCEQYGKVLKQASPLPEIIATRRNTVVEPRRKVLAKQTFWL